MATRRQQLNAVAGNLAHHLDEGTWNGERYATFEAWAAAVNRDGWTLETSGPQGRVIRHEGVILSAAELGEAVRRARADADA